MTFADVLRELRKKGHLVTKGKIEWALLNCKVSRPDKDSSGRFVWTEYYVEQLDDYFKAMEAKKRK